MTTVDRSITYNNMSLKILTLICVISTLTLNQVNSIYFCEAFRNKVK